MARLKRWLKRIFLFTFLFLAVLLIAFGAFKHSERRLIGEANDYFEKNEPYEAIKAFGNFESIQFNRLAVKYGIVDPLWHYTYGLALLRTSNYANAAREFERAVYGFKNSKEKSLAYFNFGEARLWQWDGGAFEEAALLYQEALKCDSELIIAKKRLEWLRMANLIKGESAGNPKEKGKEKSKENQQGKEKQPGEGGDEKFKQTEEKRRRGY